MVSATVRRSPGQSPAFAGAITAGGFVRTSGLVSPQVLAGHPQDLAGQAADVLALLADTLRAHDCSLADVVSLTAYLSPDADAAAWNAAFAQAFPVDPPCRTTVRCGFVLPGVEIEVSAVAVVR